MNERPSLVTKHARRLLYARGYVMGLTWEEARAIFSEYVRYYFQGLTTRAFLSALADELLFISIQNKEDGSSSEFLNILLASSTFPSFPSSHEQIYHRKALERFMHIRREVKKYAR